MYTRDFNAPEARQRRVRRAFAVGDAVRAGNASRAPAGALIAIPLFSHPRRPVHARNGDKIKEPLLAYLLLIGVGGADPPTTRALYFFGERAHDAERRSLKRRTRAV